MDWGSRECRRRSATLPACGALRCRWKPRSRYVDEKTWINLEFPRLFGVLDSTITRLGSQCLFEQLRTYADDASQTEVARDAKVSRSGRSIGYLRGWRAVLVLSVVLRIGTRTDAGRAKTGRK